MTFNCTNCQKPLEIDDTMASGTASCPFCQAIITIPPKTLPARTSNRSPMPWITLSICIVLAAATGAFFLWRHYTRSATSMKSAAKSAQFRTFIVGEWIKADGSGPWLEFTKDGKFIIWEKADTKAITLKDGRDLSYEFLADAEVRVEDFLFSVDVTSSELTMTGKGGVTILLSDGSFFPPMAGQSAKFKRKQ
jgi:hypothetical protein